VEQTIQDEDRYERIGGGGTSEPRCGLESSVRFVQLMMRGQRGAAHSDLARTY
jgi:hypothetical protein